MVFLTKILIFLRSYKLPNILLSICFLASTINTYAYSPYSTPELDDLEREFVKEINQSNQVLRDPLASQYINHIGKLLANVAIMKPSYFFIVKSNEINAFAGPGGHIGINTALILRTDCESELAAVMAHELAHVRQHHLYSMVIHEEQKRIPMIAAVLASIALGVINPALGNGALMASLTGFAQDSINFTRSKEKEADRIGMDMLKKANFDPRAMVNFFKKMQQSSRYYYTQHIPAILRTHPLDDERISEAENRLDRDKKHTANINYEYFLFKELVRAKSIRDPKILLDYYKYECHKHNKKDACTYGKAITLISINQFEQARDNLEKLIINSPNNLYYMLAITEALCGLKLYDEALTYIEKAFLLNPKNYATTLSYVEILIQEDKIAQANQILLKARRIFKKDLVLCHKHAQTSFKAKQTGFAYFTQAECEILKGDTKKALHQLKMAQKLTKDSIMQERIAAKINEIQS